MSQLFNSSTYINQGVNQLIYSFSRRVTEIDTQYAPTTFRLAGRRLCLQIITLMLRNSEEGCPPLSARCAGWRDTTEVFRKEVVFEMGFEALAKSLIVAYGNL